MDTELLIALLVLWCGSTIALIIFLQMWFSNDWAAFHPHSVDVESRHPTFLVVNSKTVCKTDCAIKSVSAFVAPRGSSSSKHFTALCMMIAIAGMLGTTRWYFVGDASMVEFLLAFFGFGSLMLVAGFELDVAPERFLEDKQMITGWLIQKLKMDHLLHFRLGPHNKEFREFIRNSPEIYHLYEEDRYLNARKAQNLDMWNNEVLWQSAHIIGAVSYVFLLPAAIILNDMAEEKVAWITGATFCLFCAMGYFTGNYVPVVRVCKCWILTWNPFLREPYFMLKLKRSVEQYVEDRNAAAAENEANSTGANGKHHSAPPSTRSGQAPVVTPIAAHTSSANTSSGGKLTSRRTRASTASLRNNGAQDAQEDAHSNGVDHADKSGSKNGDASKNGKSQGKGKGSDNNTTAVLVKRTRHLAAPVDKREAAAVDAESLDNPSLRFARRHPSDYLRVISFLMVMSELISLMTPCVAMGIQWITALCDGPPLLAIIELLWECFMCLRTGGMRCQLNSENFTSCILRK